MTAISAISNRTHGPDHETAARDHAARMAHRDLPIAAAAALLRRSGIRDCRMSLGDCRDPGSRAGLESRDHDFVSAADAQDISNTALCGSRHAATRADLDVIGQALRDARNQRRRPA